MDDMNKLVVDYFRRLEENIGELPLEEQEKLFRPCAAHCVKDTVLVAQRKIFEECNYDMDKVYEMSGDTEYLFGEIIERGHIYEMGYPRCFCYMYHAGFANSPVHCECSRQSILYIYEQLLPDKKIKVETLHTILSGADECRFRITVE